MLIINNNSVRAQGVISTADSRPLSTATAVADEMETGQVSAHSSVSVLARQLSAASARALTRDASLDAPALGQKASQVLDELLGDPHRVQQGNVSACPFQGMPRDQLTLITYDEGGEFSVAERMAALRESSSQEQLWRQSTSQRALAGFRATGNMTGFFNEALTHLRALPAIEQAQYPANYAVDLQRRIELGTDYRRLLAEAGVSTPRLLIEKSLPKPAFIQPERGCQPVAASVLPRTDVSARAAGSVDDSGRQLMVSRLFGGVEPPVKDGKTGMTLGNSAYSGKYFLTLEDRELLSDVYLYAVDNNIDMVHVDILALDIGHYRQHDNGRILGSFNSGYHYTSDGWQETVSFIDRDAAIASRLLNGAAINSTRFDQVFLRRILDPGFGAFGNRGNFPLIEHLVNYFSAEAGSVAPPGDQFATHVPAKPGEYYVLHVSSTIRAPKRNTTEDEMTHPMTKKPKLGSGLENASGVPARSFIEMLRQRGGLDVAHTLSAIPDRNESVWDPVQLNMNQAYQSTPSAVQRVTKRVK